MKRRVFMAACAVLASPAWTQGTRRFRLGFLATSDEETAKPVVGVFLAGLREKGYQPGGNLVVDFRYAGGDIARLPTLAAELVALKPDVLVGLQPAALALRARTTTIPIVLLASNDPVAVGLAKSLARPGTNVTGLANRFDQALEKHIELLIEVVPSLSRIALLNFGPTSEDSARTFAIAAGAAGRSRDITVVNAVVRNDAELKGAFALFEAQKAQALIVVPTSPALQFRRAILDHAMRLRLPVISGLPAAWSDDGALLNYGANNLADYRYVASIVDRILRGANPAEMPIEQPGRFELVVNLKSARELGIKLPQSIMARAQRVIE